MKKVLVVFIICFLAIFSTFMITQYDIDSETILTPVFELFNITNKKNIEDLKINRLQLKDYTFRYNQLDDNQQELYRELAYTVKDLKSTVSIDNYVGEDTELISKDAKTVMTAFFADHPEVFYLDLSYNLSVAKSLIYDKIQIKLTYSVESEFDLDLKIRKIEDVIYSYVNSIANKTDFEKELYLHDKLAKDVMYYNETEDTSDIPSKYHTIYGVFIEKKGVCDALSKAMQLLLDQVDIDNIFVTGKLGEVSHAWNMVKLDNEWYHLDITSDKHIKDSTGKTKSVVHTYFNVTDDFIANSHSIDDKENNYVANSNTYNYFIKTDSYIYSIEDFKTRIKEIIQAQSSSDKLEFASEVFNVPDKLLKALYDLNFNNYQNSGDSVKMKYYNEQDTYMVLKE